MKFVKGSEIPEQIRSIDRVLTHFSRRLHKTVVGVVPPNLTSEYVETVPPDGVLLKKIFPAGKLTRGFMYVEKYIDKTPVTFVAEVEGLGESASKSFLTRRNLLVIEPDLELGIGDRLTFKVLEPQKVSGIWVGFLFQVAIKDSKVEHYSIDKLEELSDKMEE